MNHREVLNAVRRNGWEVFDRPSELNIVGIRSDSVRSNSFDDLITVTWKESGAFHFRSYPATTDPGAAWLLDPMNPLGTAILASGQYRDAYQIGLHKGQYEALVQRGKLQIYRDYDRDAILDFGVGEPITCGNCGINIHRSSGTGTSKTVDKWSAGCQVFASIINYQEFMVLARRHRDLYGNKFTYSLIDNRMATRAKRRKTLYFIGGAAITTIGVAAALYLPNTLKKSA